MPTNPKVVVLMSKITSGVWFGAGLPVLGKVVLEALDDADESATAAAAAATPAATEGVAETWVLAVDSLPVESRDFKV